MALRDYNGNRFNTLTVGQLIELLQDEDLNAPVIFSTDYGDYHRTPQALPILGEVEQVTIEKSAYSNSGFAIAEDPGDGHWEDSEGGPAETFLVIR